jgi:protoporphyrinogen oxidase
VNGSDHVAIVGGGYAGLGVAYQLGKRGVATTIFESEETVGGLAASFDVGGTQLERFYHHWFNSDTTVLRLVRELGLQDCLVRRNSNTGTYCDGRIYRLSGPLDVLRFSPLSLRNRFRLGKLALAAKNTRNWRELESITAEEWLVELGGRRVYDVVWRPLLQGKFGDHAGEIAAVWIWNKLRLRGGSRGKRQREELLYMKGGFARLTRALAERVSAMGCDIRTSTPVRQVKTRAGRVTGLVLGDGTEIVCDTAVVTTAPEPTLNMLEGPPPELAERLRAIPYLASQCVILELDRSLSQTYWLNVNDTQSPFVGVIEHTNFEPADAYGGHHIVYLSKYLPKSHRHFWMGEQPLTAEYADYLPRIFPEFRSEWVLRSHVWRAPYAQPVVLRGYRELVPPRRTEIDGLWLCNMAQVYPEDRGTNYALQHGFECAHEIVAAASERQRVAA